MSTPSPTARRLNDPHYLESFLRRDPLWAVFALADLEEELFPQCDWWMSGEGLALVFHGVAIKPLFLMGPGSDVAAALEPVTEPRIYVNELPEHTAAVDQFYRRIDVHPMWRMALADFRPVKSTHRSLGLTDAEAIRELLDLAGGGVSFAPWQLNAGFYRGIEQNGRLIAVAGTQVVSRQYGVATIGNVATHPEFRGRGLAKQTTSAVVEALQTAGIPTIALNVLPDNQPAVHVYRELGFQLSREYQEGVAERR